MRRITMAMASESIPKLNRLSINAPSDYPIHGVHLDNAPKKLFGNFEQKGFISLFYSVESAPLELWDKQVRNGSVKRMTDKEIRSPVLDLSGINVASTFITMPADPYQSLGIILPVFNLIVKNQNLYFSFEIQLVDDQKVRRRFKAANYYLTSRVRKYEAIVPLHMEEGWNQISLNLQDWTLKAYGTNLVEVVRVQIHPNCRLRRVFFSDKENNYPNGIGPTPLSLIGKNDKNENKTSESENAFSRGTNNTTMDLKNSKSTSTPMSNKKSAFQSQASLSVEKDQNIRNNQPNGIKMSTKSQDAQIPIQAQANPNPSLKSTNNLQKGIAAYSALPVDQKVKVPNEIKSILRKDNNTMSSTATATATATVGIETSSKGHKSISTTATTYNYSASKGNIKPSGRKMSKENDLWEQNSENKPLILINRQKSRKSIKKDETPILKFTSRISTPRTPKKGQESSAQLTMRKRY